MVGRSVSVDCRCYCGGGNKNERDHVAVSFKPYGRLETAECISYLIG
jgi:hypothetical protein